MSFIHSILTIFDTKGAVPAAYGPYHMLCLALTALLTIQAIHFGRSYDEKKIRKTLLLTALLVIGLEIYKQINFTFGDGSSAPSFQWYAFPFQFCSTPMYVCLLAALMPKGRVHNSLCAYLSTYSVFAGVCVMLYPSDVFIDVVGINIQTMICHGAMVVIGGYLLGSGYVKLEGKTVLKAIPVFSCAVTLAALFNELAHAAGIEGFNMFFISPYENCTLPVYSLVHNVLPFPLNLAVYVLGFTAAAFIILYVCRSIRYFWTRVHVHKAMPAVH